MCADFDPHSEAFRERSSGGAQRQKEPDALNIGRDGWWARLRLRLTSPSLLGSAAWTFIAKAFSQVTQLAAFIVAARVLTSAEFGLFAYCAAFAVLLVIFAEGGWGEFVMKMPDDPDRLDQIATASILFGVVSMTVGLLGATVISFYFGEVQEAALVALFSLWLLPAALGVVYDGIMIAAGRLRMHAAIRIVADAVSLVVTVAALLYDWGVFALVAGRLVMQLTMLVGIIAVVRWLPKLRLTRSLLVELLEFSRHIVMNRLIIFVRSYSGTLAVGSFLGLAEAGYYRAAERIVAAFSEMVGEPIRVLSWVILRRVANLPEAGKGPTKEIGAAATGFIVCAMAVSVPVYIGLALMSGSLVHIVLGDAWAPAAILITLLSVKQILLIPGYLTEPLLSLSGTIRKMPAAVVTTSAISLAFILALAPFGMLAAAIAQCAGAVVSFIINVHMQSRYGATDWAGVIRRCLHPLLGVTAMVVAVALIGDVADASAAGGLAINSLQVVMGGVVYIATLTALQKLSRRSPPIFAFAHRST
jgi:Membrane protein involved in the export of O-antigen and teichoic acid